MALNFPNNPSLNETYTGSNGLIYKWDGTKWITQGSDNATGSKVEEAPQDGTVYGRVDADWQDISTTHLPLTGGTLTGGLTGTTLDATTSVSAPIVTATDHMEGVYSSQLFTVTGVVGGQGVDFDIPTWCSKIEINHLDWRSTGGILGTNVALWQFLNSGDTQYLIEPAGSRYEVQWGGGFVGNVAYLNNTSAEVYFIADAAEVAHGGTLTMHLEDTLQTNEDRFRCNFTGLGNYITAASGTSSYIQQGIMVSASPNDRPAKLRLVTYQGATSNEFLGKIKFYA